MPYDDAPETPISREDAVAGVRAYIAERRSAGVMMAEAFTSIELIEGVLTTTWNEDAVGKEKSEVLLELNPFENLATFIGTPLAFENEQGRQIRQHVHAVSVVGPFGVGTLTTQEIYQRATGLP
ncbi:hypothetical protein MWU75_14135 [Ornithinimicrobium sp. F0845]|uniref:hypothetical protein n=1 Tax=Ornithinimicrobium sp. F0845 TaxID=2926412 RepID=UPI001FF448D4|nr:hypothetical protein [Ornithinimicrobium sp. F0845]MCK0113284.1 hypothetical protein [Ornithinimicrobium sp. F0845]